MGNVTMRDVGRRVGVSAVSVSKALAGRSGVSEELRAKIIKTAADMGYVNPNAPASQPVKSLDVGILIPDHFFGVDSFYAMFYKTLVQALTDSGHFGVLELLSEEAERNLLLPNVVRSRKVDALILLGQPSKAYVRMVSAQDVPVVFLDFYDEHAGESSVVGDNSYGCYRLTSHLIRAGHKDIGFVGNRLATSSIMDRYLGFYRAMIMNGLPVREEWMLEDRDESGFGIEVDFPEKMPTALVCNCDLVAYGVIRQLQARGYRVPEDVSVVGFDDFPQQTDIPTLTTFRMDVPAMAQMAVKLVSDRCAGLPGGGRVVIGGQPIYRESDRALNVTE